MTTLAPPLPVRAPILEPPTVSLIASARTRDEGDERWGNGVAFAPQNCGSARTGVYDPCSTSYTKSMPSLNGDEEFAAIGVWGGDDCSTFSWESRDFIDRAKAALLSVESWWLEAELWTSPTVGNPHFANTGATIVGGGAVNVAEGLVLLEQALATGAYPGRAMIHGRPCTLAKLLTDRLVRREGNIYLTYMDNVFVPGRGYPGTGPAGQAVGATEWMYASGIVEVFRGPIHHFPERPEQEIDRLHNNVTVFADRLIVGMFDPCINLAVEVTEASIDFGS